MNIMTYKGYTGAFEYDADADIFHGDVLHISDVVTFEGRSIDELKAALADSVEDYLEFCKCHGRQPQKPYSGRFNVRISPDLHRRIAECASRSGKSINAWLTDSLEHLTA